VKGENICLNDYRVLLAQREKGYFKKLKRKKI